MARSDSNPIKNSIQDQLSQLSTCISSTGLTFNIEMSLWWNKKNLYSNTRFFINPMEKEKHYK